MNRREASLASLAAVAGGMPAVAVAQPARKMHHIGILGFSGTGTGPTGPQPADRSTAAFLDGMRALGYRYGEHFVAESRGPGGNPERLPALAAELVRRQPDVIIAGGGLPALALKQATSTIPIVMTQENDPVASGFVASLARPGGNITGLSTLSAELHGKQLELLKQTVPGLARVAVLGSSTDPGNARSQSEMEAAARALGMRLQYLDVLAPGDLEAAFLAMGKERAGAVLLLPTFVLADLGKQIADLGLKSRLPVMGFARQSATQGSLMFYGASTIDLTKRAATYVDKILKGAKPADLPVEQPTRFELVINLKTAKALGVTVPQSVLLRADEVIQ